jgi:hypothetical protein
MNDDCFHDLIRALATGISRGHALMLPAALLAVGLLAAFGIRPAQAAGVNPFTTSGHTVSALGALVRKPPNRTICAHTGSSGDVCFLGLCSLECPHGIFATAACFQPASSHDQPMCGGITLCGQAAGCTSNADCGPRELCAVTCCPDNSFKCIPRCPADN